MIGQNRADVSALVIWAVPWTTIESAFIAVSSAIVSEQSTVVALFRPLTDWDHRRRRGYDLSGTTDVAKRGIGGRSTQRADCVQHPWCGALVVPVHCKQVGRGMHCPRVRAWWSKQNTLPWRPISNSRVLDRLIDAK